MDEKYKHSVCDDCWNKSSPNRPPTKVIDRSGLGAEATCCACGKQHQSGIYLYGLPDMVGLKCGGNHGSGKKQPS